MTSDDILDWMASRPKRERPTPIKSDSAMLYVWRELRHDKAFRDDILCRHDVSTVEEFAANHHAVGNAWGMAVQAYTRKREMGGES